MTWEITMPVISTAHIKQETSAWLTNQKNRYIVAAKYPEGFFVSILDDMYDLGETELRITYPEVPTELMNTLLWAHRKGYYWVRLDCDGDIIEELPTFEWEIKL